MSKVAIMRQMAQRAMDKSAKAIQQFEREAEKLFLESDTEDAQSIEAHHRAKTGTIQLHTARRRTAAYKSNR